MSFTYSRVLSTSASCFKFISLTLCLAVFARFFLRIEMFVWSSILSSLQHSLSRKKPSHLLTLLYSEITSATPNIEFHLSVFESELILELELVVVMLVSVLKLLL